MLSRPSRTASHSRRVGPKPTASVVSLIARGETVLVHVSFLSGGTESLDPCLDGIGGREPVMQPCHWNPEHREREHGRKTLSKGPPTIVDIMEPSQNEEVKQVDRQGIAPRHGQEARRWKM